MLGKLAYHKSVVGDASLKHQQRYENKTLI